MEPGLFVRRHVGFVANGSLLRCVSGVFGNASRRCLWFLLAEACSDPSRGFATAGIGVELLYGGNHEYA